MGEFEVVRVCGERTVSFRCFYCKKPITPAGVQGDHVAAQVVKTKGTDEQKGLFEDIEDVKNPDVSNRNWVLSCQECNVGLRNKDKRMFHAEMP